MHRKNAGRVGIKECTLFVKQMLIPQILRTTLTHRVNDIQKGLGSTTRLFFRHFINSDLVRIGGASSGYQAHADDFYEDLIL